MTKFKVLVDGYAVDEITTPFTRLSKQAIRCYRDDWCRRNGIGDAGVKLLRVNRRGDYNPYTKTQL